MQVPLPNSLSMATSISKMSGIFHPERHVCVVWGNKTPSREVFLPVTLSHFQTGKNNTKNENIM
jgi:hypothetical protein